MSVLYAIIIDADAVVIVSRFARLLLRGVGLGGRGKGFKVLLLLLLLESPF